MTSTACRALLLAILFTAPASAQTADPTAAPAPCEQAQDEQYGYTRERAIQVGGSPLYGLARQRRYLDALRVVRASWSLSRATHSRNGVAEPDRVNGAPVAVGVVLQVRFGPS